MNIALYARVSTADQTNSAQFLELRQWAAAAGHVVVGEFSDVASGGRADRVGLGEVMALVRARGVEAVAAVKIDRMARSLVHFAQIAAEFVAADVALIIPSQGIDTSRANPCGKFQQNILAAVAEFERDLIRERTRAGLRAAREAGKTLGRVSPKMPDAATREAVVQQWRAAGGTYRELGRMLGGVGPATAMRVAKRYPMLEVA